ncbi:hypothetical protein B7486_59145 [cyanobacterium TDX16]|nr:hypothetical protein B7486_59145 [cyanobacterium TDX16]
MLSFPQVAADQLDAVLTSLPASFAIAERRSARFVAGPSGAFVVLPASDDLDADATRLMEITASTRSSLADHLAWAPFVDSLLVTPDRIAQPAAATVAPIDLLGEVLREGHQAIDEQTMDLVFVVLVEGKLAPGWRLLGADSILDASVGDRLH